MTPNSLFSRVKNDFFAIFVPGSYIFTIIFFFYLTISHDNVNISLYNRINSFIEGMRDNWVLTFIIIIICYLIGNLIRSIRVTIADDLCKKFFSGIKKNEWSKILYQSPFPYKDMLEQLIYQLKNSKLINGFELPHKDDLYGAYQYWKISICSELPDVFHYTQNLESTVRLFAGMFWAGFLGTIGSLFIFISYLININMMGIEWLKLNILLILISLIIAIIFGMNIRRVRGQEVRYVFNAYLFFHEKNSK